jgi:hypothetical protein
VIFNTLAFQVSSREIYKLQQRASQLLVGIPEGKIPLGDLQMSVKFRNV